MDQRTDDAYVRADMTPMSTRISGTVRKINVNDFEAIRDILKPYDANSMHRYPVSRKLNNSKIDDADSASPVTLETPIQERLF